MSNKKKKSSKKIVLLILILILIIVIGIIVVFIAYNRLTGDSVKEINSSIVTGQTIKQESNISSDKIHFREMPIKYYIYSMNDSDNFINYTECSEIKYFNIHKAFDVIENATNKTVNFREITYEEKNSNPDIINDNTIRIECKDYKSTGDYIVEGEAGPATIGNIIVTGEITLYHNGLDSKGVDYAEIHEILHVFGYQHVTDRASIMNPVSRYVMKIDPEIVSDLIKTYS